VRRLFGERLTGLLVHDRGRAAGGGDLGGGRSGERVRLEIELDALELTGAEDLDQFVLVEHTGVDELLEPDLAALGEELDETVEVHHLVDGPVVRLEALELRQTHLERHLAALEAGLDVLAGLGALGAAPGGLALGALAATDAGLGLLGAGSGLQVMNADRHDYSTSSTSTRWRTLWTMPRNSGRSSLTTDWRILRRPRVCMVARCFGLTPIRERTWVIFKRAMCLRSSLRLRGLGGLGAGAEQALG